MEKNVLWGVLVLHCLLVLVAACAPTNGKFKEAELLYQQGQELRTAGENTAALEKFTASYTLAKEAGYAAGMAHNLNEMAMVHSAQNDESGARELLTEAFAIYAQAGMTAEVSRTLNNMAMTYVRQENYQGAMKQYQELIVWDRRTENLIGVAITMQNMGSIYENHLARPQMARRSYLEALAIFRQLGQEDQIQAVEQSLKRLP
jgi:tetratricopeptide (TPR) repeat protein